MGNFIIPHLSHTIGLNIPSPL